MGYVQEKIFRHGAISALGLAVSGLVGACVGIAGVMALALAGQGRVDLPGHVQRVIIPELAAPMSASSDEGVQFASEDATMLVDTLALDLEEVPPTNEESANSADIARLRSRAASSLSAINDQRFMNLDFDLAERDDAIEVKKSIHLNGAALGTISVAIDPALHLHLSSADLGRLLPEEIFAEVDTGASFIAFDELRAKGLDIRYDPLGDALHIES